MAEHADVPKLADETSAEFTVLIIGSGVTGLALAQGLLKAGIKCIVFEKRATPASKRDWNMGLHWGAPVLKDLIPEGWWDRIQSVQVDPHVSTKDVDTLSFVQGDTGETMAAFSFGPFYRLRRSRLRELLSQDLDVRYGKELLDIKIETPNSVSACFTDGTEVVGNLVVGADGARSSVRQWLLGPGRAQFAASNRLPFAATFIQRRYTKEQALFLRRWHSLYLASAHPANKFAFFGMHDAADPDDPSSWTFFSYISWQSSLTEQEATADWTDAQRLTQQKDFAKEFCDPWKSAYQWTPDDAPVWYFGMTDWDPSLEEHRWDNRHGLVTILGDAAHPMTYQRGQGLNHSVTDAGKLRGAVVKIKEGGDQKELIASFEAEMIKRGGAEVRDGTANTTLLHDWSKVKQSPFFTKGMKKDVGA